MKRKRGFSLLELVGCMAILAILLTLAVPGYLQYLQRARMAEARAALMENGHFMQRWYQLRGVYHQEGPLSWPPLPVLETGAFVIGFSSAARRRTISTRPASSSRPVPRRDRASRNGC